MRDEDVWQDEVMRMSRRGDGDVLFDEVLSSL